MVKKTDEVKCKGWQARELSSSSIPDQPKRPRSQFCYEGCPLSAGCKDCWRTGNKEKDEAIYKDKVFLMKEKENEWWERRKKKYGS